MSFLLTRETHLVPVRQQIHLQILSCRSHGKHVLELLSCSIQHLNFKVSSWPSCAFDGRSSEDKRPTSERDLRRLRRVAVSTTGCHIDSDSTDTDVTSIKSCALPIDVVGGGGWAAHTDMTDTCARINNYHDEGNVTQRISVLPCLQLSFDIVLASLWAQPQRRDNT